MIRWSSIVADEQGNIDYQGRVKPLVSILLALVGGGAAIAVVFVVRQVQSNFVYAMLGALVLPLTGGKIADGFSAIVQKRVSAKIQTGDAPGRRASDPSLPPVPPP